MFALEAAEEDVTGVGAFDAFLFLLVSANASFNWLMAPSMAVAIAARDAKNIHLTMEGAGTRDKLLIMRFVPSLTTLITVPPPRCG